jgi:mannose-6-phosphate isomerase-like protein (cupin superfamily)
MASTDVQVQGIRDDRPVGAPADFAKNQKVKTKGWQVAAIPDLIPALKDGTAYVPMTDNRYAKCVINVYGPGERDEMHCHPGSEHIFMVFQGELHIKGINEGEDLVLRPGELVHINMSYFYQLHNPTDGVTVLYQVATKPPKPAKVRQYNYRGPADTIDPKLLEGE